MKIFDKIQTAVTVIGVMLLSFMIVGLFSCCNAVRKSTTTTQQKQEQVLIHDTITKKETDTVHVTKTETKVETKTNIQFDTIQKDCPQNKVIYKSNGDVEATGNIKEVNLSSYVSREKYDSLSAHAKEEEGARFYWQNKFENSQQTTKVKKYSLLKLAFLFFALGALSMWLFLFWLNKRKQLLIK